MKLLVLFLILPTLIYTINAKDDSSQEEEFGIADTQKNSDKEFETKAHHTTGSFYYVLNKSQPQTRRNDLVPASPNTRPVWRPCKSLSYLLLLLMLIVTFQLIFSVCQ